MIQETKSKVLDTIASCKVYLHDNKHDSWTAHQCVKSKEPNIIEIAGRYLRMHGYHVEFSYGDLPGYNTCYASIKKKNVKRPQIEYSERLSEKIKRWFIIKFL